ncbi:MAG: autotransporter outer membrane beta-barrel domain-containing protein [Elusimicrobia bacterium]|nr:autotransporter outer membrane beta-barrel domain-containing protein [Elusimicrobiota bacterium]
MKPLYVSFISLFFLFVSAAKCSATAAPDWATLYGLIGNGAESSITLTDNITTTGGMPTASGSKTIDGGGYTLSAGSSAYKGFQTDFHGNTAFYISNVTLENFNRALLASDNKLFTSTAEIGPGVIFQNNGSTDTLGGGAIYNQMTTTFADGTKFLNNNSYFAGAVYSNYQLIFGNDVVFNGNTATQYDGGAISMNDSAGTGNAFTRIGDRVQFINNTALNDYGGAISNEGSILTIGNSANFQGNSAGMAGAIMNVYVQSEATIGDNAVFQNNTAQYAGAIANVGGATFTIGENAQFINNSSTGAGQEAGAIGNEFSTFTIGAGALFDGNSAARVGGAIFNLDGNVTLNTAAGKATVFKNNTDSTGANDIYLLSDTSYSDAVPPVLTIAGTGGTIEFQGGIASNDDVAQIEKTSSGEMILGAAAQNKGFLGTFDQTAGTTSVYGEFFSGVNNISNSTLHFYTSNTANVLNVTNGAVDLRGSAYNTLTAGTWTASGAQLYLNTYFDGNGTNTDKLVVDGGDATGNTTIFVTSKGSNGAPTPDSSNGILVVDVTNAASKTATFALNGGVVDTGAYEYALNHASDNNWYLKSTGELTNTANTVANMPALHLTLVKAGMDELRRRMGNLLIDDGCSPVGFWARGYGQRLNVDEKISADMTLFGAEAGFDVKAVSGDTSLLYLGLMGGYISTSNIRIKQTNMFDGTGSGEVPNAGLYAVWLHENGWFADLTARYFQAKMTMQNISAAGEVIAYDADRNFVAGSLEAGRLIAVSSFVLEPKAEIRFATAGSEQHSTNMSDDVRYGNTQSLSTALRLQTTYIPNEASRYRPFIELGVYNEWLGKTDINFAGADMKSDVSGFGVEASAGLNVLLSCNAYLYGDVSYGKGSVYEALSGNIGIRFTF